jgi:sugar-specific transcriptional regulator TrmB
MLQEILKELGLPENAIRIYLRLLETGASSARQLSENLNIPRPSAYDHLKLLIKSGLAVEHEQENKKVFGVDDVKNLSRLLKSRIQALEKNDRELAQLLPTLATQTKSLEPKIRFYSGAEGIRQVLNDLLWYQDIETLTMWPISEMVEVLSKEYLEELNRRRIKQHISIRGIWPRDKIVDFKNHPYLGVGKGHLRELRTAPPGMTWNMSYWLYADKVAFISSRKELFGFVIHSHDFMTLIRAQFEVIWKISKPITPQPQYTDAFLKTI